MKPRIAQNAWDNWRGYLGNRCVTEFFNSVTHTQEENAELWAADKMLLRDPAILLGEAIARLKSSQRIWPFSATWCHQGDREAILLLKTARQRVERGESLTDNFGNCTECGGGIEGGIEHMPDCKRINL